MAFDVSHAQGEQLAQLRPANTSAQTLYSVPAGGLRTEITLLIATVREGGSSTEIYIYHDDDGTTYDDDTVIVSEQKVDFDTDNIFQAQHPGSGIHISPGGSIGC